MNRNLIALSLITITAASLLSATPSEAGRYGKYCKTTTAERIASLEALKQKGEITDEEIGWLLKMNENVDSVEILTCIALKQWKDIPVVALERLSAEVTESTAKRIAETEASIRYFEAQPGNEVVVELLKKSIENEKEGDARLQKQIRKAIRKND